jgi:anthranilate phosphoribosyltransferase
MNILQLSRLAVLDVQIKALAPIDNVRVLDSSNAIPVLEIVYSNTATQPQKDAVQATINAFLWTQGAQQAFEDGQQPNRTALRNGVINARQTINTYLTLAQPTTSAQDKAQIRALSQILLQTINRLIEL